MGIPVAPTADHDGAIIVPVDYELKELGQEPSTYRTLLHKVLHHYGALKVIARCARMSSLLEMQNKITVSDLLSQVDSYPATKQAASSVFRLYTYIILESALVMNIQGSGLAINRFMTDNIDFTTAFSICVSAIVGWKTLQSECVFFVQICSAAKRAQEKYDEE